VEEEGRNMKWKETFPRGGGWVHLKGANSMAASGLVSRSNLVGNGSAVSLYT